MILRDIDLHKWLSNNGVVRPLFDRKIHFLNGEPCLSFGLSHSGIDVRCGNFIRMVRKRTWLERLLRKQILVDPKNINEADWVTIRFEKYFDIPPKTSVLVSTVETFKLPDDAMAIGIGKSTYARCFIAPIITPLEAGWGKKRRATLTIELCNYGNHKTRIYSQEGIAQIIFFQLSGPVAAPYKGYYNEQGELPVLAKVG